MCVYHFLFTPRLQPCGHLQISMLYSSTPMVNGVGSKSAENTQSLRKNKTLSTDVVYTLDFILCDVHMIKWKTPKHPSIVGCCLNTPMFSQNARILFVNQNLLLPGTILVFLANLQVLLISNNLGVFWCLAISITDIITRLIIAIV